MPTSFEVVLGVLGSPWGVGSLIAVVVGVLLGVAAKALRRAKRDSLAGETGSGYLRFGMYAAFLLAAAGLAIGTVREFQTAAQEAKRERIRALVLELKSQDITQRRQALDVLVTHGGDAAEELVRAISEEAAVAAAASFDEAAGEPWGFAFSYLMGARPWDRPFFYQAVGALGEIGEPAVPAIFEQLQVEADRFDDLTRRFEDMAEESDARPPAQDFTAMLQAFQGFGAILGGLGEASRMTIVREVLIQALVEIGQPAVPALHEGTRSPQTLIQMTSYEALGRIGTLPQQAE